MIWDLEPPSWGCCYLSRIQHELYNIVDAISWGNHSWSLPAWWCASSAQGILWFKLKFNKMHFSTRMHTSDVLWLIATGNITCMKTFPKPPLHSIHYEAYSLFNGLKPIHRTMQSGKKVEIRYVVLSLPEVREICICSPFHTMSDMESDYMESRLGSPPHFSTVNSKFNRGAGESGFTTLYSVLRYIKCPRHGVSSGSQWKRGQRCISLPSP